MGADPLRDPSAGTYCVVAVGSVTGRTAATGFAYYTGDDAPAWDELENTDCSVAIAAATGHGTGVASTGHRALASTGVSPEAPLGLAALTLLAGAALLLTRRLRRA